MEAKECLSGEVYFLIEKDTEVIPLEVKSCKSKTDFSFNHKALDNLLYIHKNIKKAYILSRENISINERIINLPIYMIMFIDK